MNNSAIIDVYVRLVLKGLKQIEDVPERIRAQVMIGCDVIVNGTSIETE